MAVYEYKCDRCKKVEERKVRVDMITCGCGGWLRRIFSTFNFVMR